MTKVENSSIIDSFHYYDKERVLTVKLKTSPDLYKYLDVEPRTIKDFNLAESKGKFFNQNVRGKYDVEKIPNPNETSK